MILLELHCIYTQFIPSDSWITQNLHQGVLEPLHQLILGLRTIPLLLSGYKDYKIVSPKMTLGYTPLPPTDSWITPHLHRVTVSI